MGGQTTHSLSNGQEIWTSTFTGVLVDRSIKSNVVVQQDGPTVLRTSVVVPGQIRVTDVSTDELWLQDDHGQERAISMNDIGLAVRIGHRVSVVWGSTPWNETGPYFGARNHSTGELRVDLVAAVGQNLRQWGLNTGAASSLALWTVLPAALTALIAFAVSGGNAENRLALALGGLIAGGIAGFISWALLGSNLGPERRARNLIAEINEAARKALLAQT